MDGGEIGEAEGGPRNTRKTQKFSEIGEIGDEFRLTGDYVLGGGAMGKTLVVTLAERASGGWIQSGREKEKDCEEGKRGCGGGVGLDRK